MSITPKQLAQAALGLVAAPLFTSNSGVTLLKDVSVANSAGAEIRVFLHLVPAGGIAGLDNVFLPGIPVAPGGLVGWSGLQVLEEGAQLVAFADALGLTLTASGAVVK